MICSSCFLFSFFQISEESTGPPPLDEISIEDESNWIYNQLASGTVPLFGRGLGSKEGQDLSVNRDDIIRFLDLQHVQKLDVSIKSMLIYQCLI